MTDHPLRPLMEPESVAVVGATQFAPGRMGTRTLHDFAEAKWPGRLYPVTQKAAELYGYPTFASLAGLPEAVDLVIARVPAQALEKVVDDAIANGAKALIALASGFAETGDDGRMTQQRIADKAQNAGLRLLGPQSIGHINFLARLPATLSALLELVPMRGGDIALLSQSGALSNYTTVEAWQRGLTMSHVVTFGNAADVTPAEVIDYLADVPETRVIACYLEGVGDPDAFRAACTKAVTSGKRVVALKSGRSERGRQAVASHTASMTGSAEAFDALCTSSGVMTVRSISELLDVAAVGRLSRKPPGPVGMISFSGASCALFADYCAAEDLEIAALNPGTESALTEILPWFLKPAMPFDVGQIVFDHELFARALTHIAADTGIGTLVVNMHTINPAALCPDRKIEAIKAMQRASGKPVVVVWEAARPEDAQRLRDLTGCAVFADLARAVRALGRVQCDPEADVVEQRCPDSVPRPSSLADEHEAKAFLAGLGLPIPEAELLTSESLDAQEHVGFPHTGTFALKIVSSDIQHKTEVGGVALDVNGAEVCDRACRMLTEVRAKCPDARLRGVLAERMAPAGSQEMVISVLRDVECGPVLTIGAGGTAVELYRDVARRVCPVSVMEVRRMVGELKSAPLLEGFRGGPPSDLDALMALVERISQIAVAAPWLMQLELNPVLVGRPGEGVLVVDALAEIDASHAPRDAAE
ncbi:acetate--CoA ligase family protein [Sediminimonas qiaohouensis]|uniref:acetate--CoA ligase family protein n=1 Tax=Sediminimonas qiaohouensis TaxID=552061 RepID=UPI0004262899|nr:acetate--CoA ligase family protein [Sediminimonas qiaohouensis]